MNYNFSQEYKPISPDWTPPTWLSSEPTLKPIDNEVTERIKAASQGKFFSPARSLRAQVFRKISSWIGGEKGTNLSLLVQSLTIGGVAIGVLGRTCGIGGLFASLGILGVSMVCDGLKDSDLYKLLEEAHKNPLFEQVWSEVTAKRSISLHTVDRKEFMCGDKESESNAHCHSIHDQTDICIHHRLIFKNNIDLNSAFSALIFETVNAWQKDRFEEVVRATERDELDREGYAMLTEYVEEATCRITTQIIEYGVQHLNWDSTLNTYGGWQGLREKTIAMGHHPFALFWMNANLIPSMYGISHAGCYRVDWDKWYSTKHSLNLST